MTDFLQARGNSVAILWVSSLMAHPADFELASLHNCMNQLLKINVLYMYTSHLLPLVLQRTLINTDTHLFKLPNLHIYLIPIICQVLLAKQKRISRIVRLQTLFIHHLFRKYLLTISYVADTVLGT